MAYSEKTQRELDKYTRKLVRAMPRWIRKLFNTNKLLFQVDKNGALELCCVESIKQEHRDKVGHAVYKYMDENPCKAFGVLSVEQ